MVDDWATDTGSGARRPVSARRVNLQRDRVLLVVSGSIAASSMPEWVRRLRVECGWRVRVCVTHSATSLVSTSALAIASQAPVEGPGWNTEHGVVPHLELAQWPDLVIVAPATMNFVAKCAAGMADSLALTTVLCTHAPVLIAPTVPASARHRPSVLRNLRLLEEDGFHVVPGEPGFSAHLGTVVDGAMPSLPAVLRHARRVLSGTAAQKAVD